MMGGRGTGEEGRVRGWRFDAWKSYLNASAELRTPFGFAFVSLAGVFVSVSSRTHAFFVSCLRAFIGTHVSYEELALWVYTGVRVGALGAGEKHGSCFRHGLGGVDPAFPGVFVG